MRVRQMRLERAWSQEQLAEMSGLSVRTIQRIERGQKPSLESLKSLAAVFDTHVNQLIEEDAIMNQELGNNNQTDLEIVEYVRDIKGFYSHLTNYVVVISLLFVLNFITDSSYIWAWWPAMGWGIGVLNHAVHTFEWFNWFGAKWERRQIEKRLKDRE